MRRRELAAGLALLVVVVAAAVLITRSEDGEDGGVRGSAASRSALDDGLLARASAQRFLRTYVDGDGRVVRRDQGDDTVSEGQAYAMLLAAAIGDRATFARVWRWTRTNLRRDDGLLSYLWRDGSVADPQAASDADLDAARALLVAGRRFADPGLTAQGRSLGAAILRAEVSPIDGRPVLVAGPWATGASSAVVNPSYWSPRSFDLLRTAAGDPRFTQLAGSSRAGIAALTQRGRLPPNWAVETAEGITATGPPGQDGAAPDFAFDAVRVPLRLAEDCDARGRVLAARLWPVLEPQVRDGFALRTALDGTPIQRGDHPGIIVAAAASALAAGRPATTRELLHRADEVDARQPTYYGAALAALGRVMLTTDLLGSCPR